MTAPTDPMREFHKALDRFHAKVSQYAEGNAYRGDVEESCAAVIALHAAALEWSRLYDDAKAALVIAMARAEAAEKPPVMRWFCDNCGAPSADNPPAEPPVEKMYRVETKDGGEVEIMASDGLQAIHRAREKFGKPMRYARPAEPPMSDEQEPHVVINEELGYLRNRFLAWFGMPHIDPVEAFDKAIAPFIVTTPRRSPTGGQEAEPPVLPSDQPDYRRKYEELIYAVASKFPGESRHETALRYITQAENRPCNGPHEVKESGK